MANICTPWPLHAAARTLTRMAVSQDVVILNDFGGSTFDRRTRTTSRGTKDRYTITIKAEPILHNFNGLRLGEGPAHAIRDLIRRQIKNIGTFAKPATIAKREAAVRALSRGAQWAKRRYAGGRTGEKAPNTSGRLFNDSGRLADGLEVRENTTEQSWTINVPVNRLNPEPDGHRTFTATAFERMLQELVRHVPALRGGEEILKDETVRQAIASATADAITVMKANAINRRSAAWRSLATSVWNTLGKPILIG